MGRAVFVLVWMAWSTCAQVNAPQLLPDATEQPRAAVAALAERLGVQLLAANKKKPFILDLSLPNDLPCPLGAWFADRISESLAQAHPELEVIARDRWSSARGPAEFAHDRNQEYAQNERRAQSLGAEVLVQGNFAAVPGGIGVTLIASDRIAGGESRFETLAEIPITTEMQAVLTSPLPPRAALQGVFRASMAGISSPLCEICPAPEYTYVAKAKKLQGVVITQVSVGADGAVENVTIVRTPSPALANAAIRTVHNWRFKPAHNVQGESVPVIVDVAVAFRLDVIPRRPAPPALTSPAGSAIAADVAKSPGTKF
ncbi:MAG: outer rane transport energization protein TonB [Candidatus Acidoferrum typicum]|nr:outer rane transport energization protein TonB [Candidatus Acidoferrum typicum]